MLAIAGLAAGAVEEETEDVNVAPSDVDTPLFNSSYEMYINPDDVILGIRTNWCLRHTEVCSVLCKFETKVNECKPVDLTWKCICNSDNKMPAMNKYIQSIPSLVCYTLASQCVDRYKEIHLFWGGFQDENQALLKRCWDEIDVHCGTRDLGKVLLGGYGSVRKERGRMHILRDLEAKGFYNDGFWDD